MKIIYDCQSKPRSFFVCRECEEMLHEAGYVLTHQGNADLGDCDVCEHHTMVYPVTEARKARRQS